MASRYTASDVLERLFSDDENDLDLENEVYFDGSDEEFGFVEQEVSNEDECDPDEEGEAELVGMEVGDNNLEDLQESDYSSDEEQSEESANEDHVQKEKKME